MRRPFEESRQEELWVQRGQRPYRTSGKPAEWRWGNSGGWEGMWGFR